MQSKTSIIKQHLPSCVSWIVICLLIAGISGWATTTNMNPWYTDLQKPFFNPPSWVFGPVWTVLYVMIGISGGIIWNKRKENSKAFFSYLLQLFFNACWSFLFFAGHLLGLALLDMTLLIAFLALTIVFSYKKIKYASWLLTPYFIWVAFAFTLNLSLWVLN